MRKWEYCMLGPFGPNLEPLSKKISIEKLTDDGIYEESYPGEEADCHLASELIAHLGTEGWQLVTAGSFDVPPGLIAALYAGPVASRIGGHMLYFKRLIKSNTS